MITHTVLQISFIVAFGYWLAYRRHIFIRHELWWVLMVPANVGFWFAVRLIIWMVRVKVY